MALCMCIGERPLKSLKPLPPIPHIESRAHRTSPQTLFLVTSLYFCRAEASETRCAGAIEIQALQSPGLPVG